MIEAAEVNKILLEDANVANIRERYEQLSATTTTTTTPNSNNREQSTKRNNNKNKNRNRRRRREGPSCCSAIVAWFRTSRFGGIPFALLYGLFIYYYVAFVILSPNYSSETVRSKNQGNMTVDDSSVFFEDNSCPDPFEIPEHLISALGDNLSALKGWVNKLMPEIDVSGLNLPELKDRIRSHPMFNDWISEYMPDVNVGGLKLDELKDLIQSHNIFNDTSSSSTSSSSNVTSPVLEGRSHIRHTIGGSLGLALAVGLSTSSVFSRQVRCGMMLVVPGMFAGRGRALLLTVAAGFLLDGPIRSINTNVEEVVKSLSCMYSEMMKLACNFQSQFMNVLSQVGDILVEIQEIIKRQREDTASMAGKLVGAAEEKAKQMQRRLDELHDKIETLVNIVKVPIKIAGVVCDVVKGVKSVFTAVVNGVGTVLNSVGNFFKGLFGRRRKRSGDGCGILPSIPSRGGSDESMDNEMSSLKKWANKLKANVNFADVTLDKFGKVIQTQSISELRRRIVNILKDVFRFIQNWSEHLKKVFYVLSLVLIIYDASSYLRQYSSDDSYDNMFVDDNLRRLWKQEPFLEKLTPLRHWELNEKYQVSLSVKLSKEEVTRIFVQAIPTTIFAAVALCAVVADYALASLLALLQKYGDFAISFKGMEQGFDLGALFGEVQEGKRTLASLKLEAYDLTSEPCLPRPVYTSYASLGTMTAILVTSLVSCIFDAYASRWRAVICNAFYVLRAKTRGEYLYRRIRAGRGNRRFQLKLVVIKELDRRENLMNFSWLTRTIDTLKKIMSIVETCPGCSWKLEKEEVIMVEFREMAKVTSAKICTDCHKDY